MSEIYNENSRLTVALTKGRLEDGTTECLRTIGMDVSALENKGRRLLLPVGEGLMAVLAKAPDVVTYVEHGVCDMGVVGKDTLMESSAAVFEALDLGFGACKFALAGRPGTELAKGYTRKKIATKYPSVAKKYFDGLGLDVEIIKIEGSVELAPLLGLADAIVDIVETGGTLAENGLVVLQDICRVSARLIVNTASMRLRRAKIEEFIGQMRKAVNGNA